MRNSGAEEANAFLSRSSNELDPHGARAAEKRLRKVLHQHRSLSGRLDRTGADSGQESVHVQPLSSYNHGNAYGEGYDRDGSGQQRPVGEADNTFRNADGSSMEDRDMEVALRKWREKGEPRGAGKMVRRLSNEVNQAVRRGSHEMIVVFRNDDGHWKRERLALLSVFFVVATALIVGLVVVGNENQALAQGTDMSTSKYLPIPPPPPNLNAICDPKEIAMSADLRVECEEACHPASCCWVIDPTKSCFVPWEHACGRYGPCGSIVAYQTDGMKVPSEVEIRPSETVVPEPPEQLPEYCTLIGGAAGQANAIVADQSSCLEHCTTASCCLERGPRLSCRSNVYNAGSCHFYESYCSNLPQNLLISDYDGKIPSPPAGLRQVCAKEMIKSDAHATAECEHLCLPGLCCVGLGLEVDCLLSDEADCQDYKRHCATVWPAEVYGAVGVPRPLDMICGDSSLATDEGKSICDEICQQGACCWEKGLGNCNDFNGLTCADYAFCPSFNRSDVEGDTKSDPPMPARPLDEICSISNILHEDGLYTCKSACALGACCFHSVSDKGCPDNPVCPEYQVCAQLPYKEWSTHRVPPPLEYICSAEQLETDIGKTRCFDACKPGSCCLTSIPGSCFSDHPGQCRQYAPCRANVAVPQPAPELAAVCDYGLDNPDAKLTCIEICQPAACCWEDESHTGPGLCWSTNEYTCLEYSEHCLPVRDELSYGMGPDIEVLPAAEACSAHSLEIDAGIEACRELCESAWCCVAEDPLSCYDENPFFCRKYEPICGPVLLSDVLYQDEYEEMEESGNTIGIICSMKSVMTLAGRGDCESACSSAVCCYSDESDSSCTIDFCTEMEVCNIFFQDLNTNYDTVFENSTPEVTPVLELSYAVPNAPSNIENLCSETGLSTFTGRLRCDEACALADCCDLPAYQGGCHEGNSDACESYWPCDSLRF